MIARFNDEPFRVVREVHLDSNNSNGLGGNNNNNNNNNNDNGGNNNNNIIISNNNNNNDIYNNQSVASDVTRGGPQDNIRVLSCDTSQVLFLPQCASPDTGMSSFFIVHEQQDEPTCDDEDGDGLLVLLDTSASMNHDENGRYLAPGSDDHVYSSMKKAKSVISELVASSFETNVKQVAIVPWFDKIGKAVKISLDDVRQEDDVLLPNLAQLIGSKVAGLRAEGATNLEAALDFAIGSIATFSDKKKGVLRVWLVTDGEPTFQNRNGEADYIPTNRKDALFGFYNHKNESGLTEYEESLCEKLRKMHTSIRDMKVVVEWHFVCFSDAGKEKKEHEKVFLILLLQSRNFCLSFPAPVTAECSQ